MADDLIKKEQQLRAARARELYNQLPEVYRIRDWQYALETFSEAAVRKGESTPELEAFLGIIADEIIRLRVHIADLWDNYFIETCDDWVVPYIGDLLGVNLVFNAAQRNRVDVKNTIEWRRRKGTLKMLADLAGDITGWGAAAVEFFENLGWVQNLDHIKLDHVQTIDLRDYSDLGLIGTARDPWLHNADIRWPHGRQGWYGIKNVGFFLSRLMAYPLLRITPQSHSGVAGCFWFDPLGRDLPLFDGEKRQPIKAAQYAFDPQSYFGTSDGFTIRQHGIPLAASRLLTPEPTEIGALWSGFGPANVGDPAVSLGSEGLEWMEPEKFENTMKRFILTAVWRNDPSGPLDTLGTLESMMGTFTTGAAASNPGVMMIRVELDAGLDAALFPETIVAVRNDRPNPRVSDSRDSRYRDVLYVYLPEAYLGTGEVLHLYVAADGSTYYAHETSPHIGAIDVDPVDLLDGSLDRTLLARAGFGQCFPPRRLTNSFEPSDLVDLHRVSGLRLADEALFSSAGREFLIEARLYADDPNETELVGQLATYSAGDLTAFQYKPQTDVFIPENQNLILKVSLGPLSSDKFFPMSDLIITERDGGCLLVNLPEMDFETNGDPVWLYFDTVGATYYASSDFGHDTALSRPERGVAFRLDLQDLDSGLARKSTGQVLALSGRFPLQNRIPMYADLCTWDHPKPRPPRSGQVSVDPSFGRFRFATGETPSLPLDGSPLGLQVDYHEGFPYDVGALTFDRFPSLKTPENPAPTRLVVRNGDADEDSIPIHTTLADALSAAQDGDVIQIEDSATYDHNVDLEIPGTVRRLSIQAANRQRPCLRFTNGAKLRIPGAMETLRLNGLFISGTGLEIDDASLTRQIDLIACTFNPITNDVMLVAGEGSSPKPVAQINLCRCVGGGMQLGRGVAEVIVSDSIIDRWGKVAIGNLIGGETQALIHLERVTVLGTASMRQLYASECLLHDLFDVRDRQEGCIRYSRYQLGSSLPRRFQCVPEQNEPLVDPVTPVFNSRRFGCPDYAQLHFACPDAIQSGAENGSEMGAYHGGLASLRVKNLDIKLSEYLPVGLKPALIYVT